MSNNNATYKKRVDENLRNVDMIKNAAMVLVQDLHTAGRPDLTPPFLDVLRALADVDYAALEVLDAEQSAKGVAR